MTPILREYILKGLFLGLWAYLALVQDPAAPDWPRFGRVLIWMTAGLIVGLIAGGVVQIRRGYRPADNLKAFPLVVLIESSFWIYAGILGGLTLGLVLEYDPRPDRDWLGYCAVGGAVLGYGFYQLRGLRDSFTRFLVALIVGGIITYLALHYLFQLPSFTDVASHRVLGTVILAGLPFFYLLTFCGEAEESEVEIAALCAALGIGLYLIFSGSESLLGDKWIFLAPLIIYFVYVTRWLPFLRVFKHTLRGYTAMNLEQPIAALRAFRRALTLSPNDELATEGMWALHQRIDVARLPADSPILSFLDYEFCLNQAAAYLVGPRTPSEAERNKALRMIDLVERQKPVLAARADYLRAVALTHAKQFDDAANVLARLLDPATPYSGESRKAILLDAWDLALRLHPELVRRLGESELEKPGRRMEAIGAVERRLRAQPNDARACELKDYLYAGLTESEFVADAASGAPDDFNYDYVEQLGLTLLETQRERGMAYLRIAGRGLPSRAVVIFAKLAEAADGDAVRGYLEQVKRAGLQAGVQNLTSEQRGLYFAAIKKLAVDAEARKDYESAIGDYRLLLESGHGELEQFRKLADLYELAGDDLNALLMTETALVYNATDKDLLTRKDRYYAFVTLERVRGARESISRFFDVEYCVNKARQILEQKEADGETLNWALHLARLATIIQPESTAARLIEARALLRRGDRDAALIRLEDLRETKPSGANDDAWYTATKILGDLYFQELDRPDLAVRCYLDFREYSKSGADTLFNAARCYEAMDQPKNAIKYYEAVLAYEHHPKYWDAKSALERLRAG